MHLPDPTSSHRRLRFAAVTFAAALAVGCAGTPEKRIAAQQLAFDTYPAEVQQKIRTGDVAVGFTPEQVRLAAGEPDRQYRRESAEGDSEVWAYSRSSPLFGIGLGIGGFGSNVGGGVGVNTGIGGNTDDRLRVVFVNGVVSSVERTETP